MTCHKRYTSLSISEKLVSLDEVRKSVTNSLIKNDSLDEIHHEIFKLDMSARIRQVRIRQPEFWHDS